MSRGASPKDWRGLPKVGFSTPRLPSERTRERMTSLKLKVAVAVAVMCMAPHLLHAQTSDSKMTAASYEYFDCLVRAAISLDDQNSDATTIARAIEGSCSNELARWADDTAAEAGISPKDSNYADERDAVEKAFFHDPFKDALKAVLYERKHRNSRP